MNNIILENLSAYCDEFIGETPSQRKKKKSKVNQIKADNTKVESEKENVKFSKNVDCSRSGDIGTEKPDKNIDKKTNLKCSSADERLGDASSLKKDNKNLIFDISDPESRQKEDKNFEEKLKGNCSSASVVTDDGFKIQSSIPSDDSDVSDAFDESDCNEAAAERLQSTGNQGLTSNFSHSNDISRSRKSPLTKKLGTMKKPLLELIKHFDMEDKLYLNKKSKIRLKIPSQKNEPKNKNKKKCFSNKDITVIDYSDRKEKKKDYAKPARETKKGLKDSKNVDKEKISASFKEARNEIYKLGLSGFNKEDQKSAKLKMLIKLGARPPKNKAVNYKVLMEERKMKKEMERKDREEKRRMGIPVAKTEEKANRNRDIVSIQNAPVGKFKDGVLSLSKKDIRKINSKR